MTIDTNEVMADTIARMDEAYAALRKVVVDESVLNVSCGDMAERRVALNDAIHSVFETRNSFREMARRRKSPPATT